MSENVSITGLSFKISRDLSLIYPGAYVGILVLKNLKSSSQSKIPVPIKQEIFASLQERFPDPAALKDHPVINAYATYYKQFKKSYHVLGQLQSVIFEKRSLPSGLPLVEAVFSAELKNMLLTAVHDLDAIQSPVKISVASGEELYTTLGGNEQRLKSKDMYIRDQAGILSSVIYGPDQRTRVTTATSSILVTVYAPEGIGSEAVAGHLNTIRDIYKTIAPKMKVVLQKIFPEHLKK